MSAWDPTRARAVVAGLGRSGLSAADALLSLGAEVLVVDDGDGDELAERARVVETLGGRVRLGAGASAEPLGRANLVIVSPGWHPDHPLLLEAAARGVPVWGDVELAWRLNRGVPWLGVTGTNGKTTTVGMLESMLAAAGLRTGAFGNVGRPVLEAVLDDEADYDVLALELSSFQLHYAPSLSLHSAVVLNLQPDHLEWHGTMEAYAADKARVYHSVQRAAVYSAADAATEKMVEDADVVEGARAIGFTLGVPAVSMFGVVDGLLVDRAFIEQRWDSAVEVAKVSDVHPFAPHNVANALAAAALARSFGVAPQAVAEGLRQVKIGDHRIQTVLERDGVRYVDDSKATNPAAAAASLSAFDSVVWVAGGQAKGTRFDELVRQHRDRVKAVALLGVDQDVIADALARQAPDTPVFATRAGKDEAMRQAVEWARSQAKPGDTVLLAPGCASLDMYSGYDERGDAFAAAARAAGGEERSQR
ncbi:MAG: UDP-N-acetylmuramoyl-L-alanine--D-glutamate ligase [Propionibacteriaceae bacterium]|jgi:UDP-N-acetylmuramoylalanine--D-glutamate ligase|nr:UDP-N-acetylmuramoyl-L-alanine--D-glutamate ligase [Propionibacteriaceae bacterium]